LLSDEHVCLDENKYIGDLVAEFKATKEKTKGGEMVQCKLLFKKRLFRETDEAITDSVFVQLSFVQVGHLLLGDIVFVGFPWVGGLNVQGCLERFERGTGCLKDWVKSVSEASPRGGERISEVRGYAAMRRG
jgi:hypothetical protein